MTSSGTAGSQRLPRSQKTDFHSGSGSGSSPGASGPPGLLVRCFQCPGNGRGLVSPGRMTQQQKVDTAMPLVTSPHVGQPGFGLEGPGSTVKLAAARQVCQHLVLSGAYIFWSVNLNFLITNKVFSHLLTFVLYVLCSVCLFLFLLWPLIYFAM